MMRIALTAAASALMLSACADHTDYNTYPDGGNVPWQQSRGDHEIDYEIADRVLFRNDSAELGDHADHVIAALAEEARQHRGATIVVDGYTDTTGAPDHNLDLSRERAQTVASALMKEGVNDRRIEAHGFGEAHLAVPTADQVSEPRNRRVVIRLMET
jgi:outer membrane protein OmpA-like peptidoglycan-associated protein